MSRPKRTTVEAPTDDFKVMSQPKRPTVEAPIDDFKVMSRPKRPTVEAPTDDFKVMSRPKRPTVEAPAAIDERIKRQRDELWTKSMHDAIRQGVFDTPGGGLRFVAQMLDADPVAQSPMETTLTIPPPPTDAKQAMAPVIALTPTVVSVATGPTQYEENVKCKQCHAGAVSRSGFDLGVCSDCWAHSFASGKIKTTGFEDMLKVMMCVVCRNAPIYRHDSNTASFTCQDCFKGRTPYVKVFEKEMFLGKAR